MNDREGIMIWMDQREALSLLTPEEVGMLFSALVKFGEYGDIPDFGDNKVLAVAFAFMKTRIDEDM